MARAIGSYDGNGQQKMVAVASNSRLEMKRKSANLEEYLCGWGAAFINITITYPINKVMFRQMLHGIDSQRAVYDLKTEGIQYLYRGILPPLFQKTVSAALMFGMYEQCQRWLTSSFPSAPHFMTLSTSAMIAGTAEALLTPLERIQTLLQDKHYHRRFPNSFGAAVELRRYGLREYFRGLSPILMRNGPSNVLFFAMRGNIKQVFPVVDHPLWDLFTDFVSGAVSGAVISTIFYPMNVIKTHMQSRIGGEYITFLTSFNIIFDERGRSWRKMFYGVHINYTRALISWGIINASYELLKKGFFNNVPVS